MLTKQCHFCGKTFEKKKTRSLKSWNKVCRYCSFSCSNMAKIGTTPWNKGTKGLMVAWNKGLPGLSGESNGAWKGTDDKYWRRSALRRDNHTCQSCGLNEPAIMEVDHILPKSRFPELRHKLDNLITLCPNCHKRKTIADRIK